MRSGLHCVATTLTITALVVASLLTFPSSIPWMIGVWILWHSIRVAKGHAGWLPLVACAAIVVVKRTALPPGIIGLGLVVAGVGILAILRARSTAPARWRRFAWLGVGCLWIDWAGMALDWHFSAHATGHATLAPARPVVCLGDSLTSGEPPHAGYPADLARLLNVPVLNLGKPGITSEDALRQLPALAASRPQVVVIELGGHDYLRGCSRAATRENLQAIVRASHDLGAEVVLMEIPRGFMTDPFAGLEREIARQHDLELVSDTPIRKLVLFSPHAPPGMWTRGPYLSDDGLHPNAAGNRVLAQAVTDALAGRFGPDILAPDTE